MLEMPGYGPGSAHMLKCRLAPYRLWLPAVAHAKRHMRFLHSCIPMLVCVLAALKCCTASATPCVLIFTEHCLGRCHLCSIHLYLVAHDHMHLTQGDNVCNRELCGTSGPQRSKLWPTLQLGAISGMPGCTKTPWCTLASFAGQQPQLGWALKQLYDNMKFL